jgi:hypothetical protein
VGLRSAHVDFGFIAFDDSFYHPMLQRVVASIRKYRGEAGALAKDLLLRVLSLFDIST